MTKHRITAAALSLTLIAGGAAAATAATTKPKAPAPAAQFESNLAKELGVSVAKLRSATKESGLDTVRALKASGRLDASKAAKAEKAIKAGRTARFMQLGKTRPQGSKPAALLARQLGSTPKDVRASLKAGRAPATLITEAGKDPAAVKASIAAIVRKRLDARVKAGKLTSAQADARAEKLAARVTGTEPLGKKRG